MLPGIALLAVDCVSIIVGVVADAFDGIWLLVDRLRNRRERIVSRDRPRSIKGSLI